MRLLNSDEMKQVEQFTAKYGLSYQRMMENAGAACARNIRAVIEKEGIKGKIIELFSVLPLAKGIFWCYNTDNSYVSSLGERGAPLSLSVVVTDNKTGFGC